MDRDLVDTAISRFRSVDTIFIGSVRVGRDSLRPWMVSRVTRSCMTDRKLHEDVSSDVIAL
jgi:hypothetical protein